VAYVTQPLGDDPAIWGALFSWLFTHTLGKAAADQKFEQQSRSWIDEWLLGKIIIGALQEFGLDEGAAGRSTMLIKLLASQHRWSRTPEARRGQACPILEEWLKDDAALQFLQVNRYGGVLWFNQEAFDQLLWWMLLVSALPGQPEANGDAGATPEHVVVSYGIIKQLQAAAAVSEYRVERLLEAAKSEPTAPATSKQRKPASSKAKEPAAIKKSKV